MALPLTPSTFVYVGQKDPHASDRQCLQACGTKQSEEGRSLPGSGVVVERSRASEERMAGTDVWWVGARRGEACARVCVCVCE